MKYIYLLIGIFSFGFANGQHLHHGPKAFTDSTGRYYQQASMPVYIFISASKDSMPVLLQSKASEQIQLEGHGIHKLKHENYITHQNDIYEIYADGKSPVTRIRFLDAPSYTNNKMAFYGAGLKIALTADDEMSGVEHTYHALNGKNFTGMDRKVISFDKEGEYHYSYYSVDRTGNAEPVHNKEFIVDLSAPLTYHHIISISSEGVISTNSTIYLTAHDSASGPGITYYKFDQENFKEYTGGNIPFTYLEDGDHALTYYSTDHVENRESEKSVKFYLDKTAPIMSADILGDKFLVEDKVYFSGRTKLKLTAVDNKSGVKSVKYTIDEGEEQVYMQPFYLPNISGIHRVKFHAVDRSDNPTSDNFMHSVGVIYVDLTGPSLSHSFDGPTFIKGNDTYLSPLSEIKISGEDLESGLNTLSYRLTNADKDSSYTHPIRFKQRGRHTLQYFGYDHVNNKNSKSTTFIVDDQGPEITYEFSSPPNANEKYPSYTTLFLAAMDKEVGIGRITYRINKGKEKTYQSPIRRFGKNKEILIIIKAYDLLNNLTETELRFVTGDY
ncbi:MAG: hypothetical protein MI975_10230 [Cytophagales bacterium]|nr:hypothetical protein [Cytophagales bacterium]